MGNLNATLEKGQADITSSLPSWRSDHENVLFISDAGPLVNAKCTNDFCGVIPISSDQKLTTWTSLPGSCKEFQGYLTPGASDATTSPLRA